METGHLIPESVIYYRYYPLGHILGGIGGLISSISADSSMFFFVVGGQVLGLIGVFLFTRHFSNNIQLSLLAMLVVANSAGPLQRGSQIFAQTYAISLISLIIWLMIRRQTTKLFLISLILVITAFLGHHSIAFTIPMVLISLFLASYVTKLIPQIPKPDRIYPRRPFIPTIFMLLGMFASYYWISIDQIRGQVNRVYLILSFGTSSADEAVSETAGLQPPTTVFFGESLPPILVWSAPLLAMSILVGLVGLFFISDVFSNSRKHQYIYPISTGILFGGFGLAFALGGQTAVTRILPTITIFVTPIIAIISQRLSLKRGGKIISIVLCVLIFTASIISPAVAIPDRSNDDFKSMQTSDEIVVGEWAAQHANSIVSGSYMRGQLYWNDIKSGTIPTEEKYRWILWRGDARDTSAYYEYWESDSESSIFIWQSYYQSYYQVDPPEDSNRIYDNGNNKIYRS